jgi:hypothetical protein
MPNVMEIREPKTPGTIRATSDLLGDYFNLLLLLVVVVVVVVVVAVVAVVVAVVVLVFPVISLFRCSSIIQFGAQDVV